MKRALLSVLLVLMIPLAIAGPYGGRQPRDGKGQGQYQRDASQDDKRQNRRLENNGAEQRQQRLSPEERRQLRRDVRDAGKEVYPRR